jgi:hypothetical protein
VLAGAAVGLIHSAIGLSLRGLWLLIELLLWDQRLAIAPFVKWIAVIGGFALTQVPRPLAAGLTLLAAPLAGAAAGLLYARMLPPRVSTGMRVRDDRN